jgi:hypothetical protein
VPAEQHLVGVDPKHWHQLLGEPTLADAMVDRIINRANKIARKGPTQRWPNRAFTMAGIRMKPRLLLIHPFERAEGVNFADTAALGIPSLSLMQVAGLTPDTWEVKLVDERFDPIDYDEPV